MPTQRRPSTLRIEVLGPLRLVVDGEIVDVPGSKRRALLVLLAIAEGAVVPVDALLDALWPAGIPDTGRQALQNHISRLRAQLGSAADRLETLPGGYRLALEPDELDVIAARTRLAAAQTGSPGSFETLREAYDLWRGPELPDLTEVDQIATAVEGYARLHREIADALVAVGVTEGHAGQVADLAASSWAADPLREQAVLGHMRALAATGRVPEALRVAREFRRRLADETGLDPSAALSETEREIAASVPDTVGPQIFSGSPRLIGRETQIASVRRTLETERLVTIVGPGGVGKTSVALAVARATPNTTLVSLAPITEAAAIAHTLAAALNLRVEHGDVLAACVAVLGQQPATLVIDNCEHLADAARDTVTRILAACPDVRVLATSRESLGLPVEFVFRLAPLPVPAAGDDPAGFPSVALFLERAQRVRPAARPTPDQLATVADIVSRLDGMPLAIELAAGRLSTFSLRDLHARLDRSLDLFGGGRSSTDARHRTLRATIEWSYRLLSDDEQALFRSLSVFPDGVDLDTAERVAAELNLATEPGEALARLVDASMVDASFRGATRYRMLETLRAFGLDRLAAAGEQAAATDRMLSWASALADRIGTGMESVAEADADTLLRREMPNLRAAWRSARTVGAVDVTAAIVLGLYNAIAYRDLIEIRHWAEELAADPALAGHARAGAVFAMAGEAWYHDGDYRQAERLAGVGLDLADGPDRWYGLSVLSVADLARGEWDRCVDHSLAAAELAPQRDNLGIAALARVYAGDVATARDLNARGSAAAVSPSMRSWAAYVDGEIENIAGDAAAAERHYLRAIDLAHESGATFFAGVATVGLLTARTAAGRFDEALRGYREVLDYFTRTGNWTHQWTALRNLAMLLRRLGDDDTAALIDTAADHAPDAPALAGASAGAGADDGAAAGRAEVLGAAREAIDRHLTQR
ncbi:BTAD domain-containing putative transcriptional regulator [Gordonia rhizosphera]|uniref:Putative AfsR family transcriptional regulator n=1 Tax=Gordonia rhizosphera NBRC 16068 TaxID=1108045 RepID=K6V7C8_9ACTN|nr:BTAD domain-containing putative transcriptional regulator [Gordonia rhizosphera]GAB92143.1 putative AfsR family transcriptional regulator [Gordonia rhizosphera NBRC 16068]